ncbi:hypothetical protein [Fimbriiglobus ruber]|uniref:hypothetical protein n=1 Tax=Fimbriiglobus ruber TaxID=1908690 RepID=UPI001EE76C0D|nr:hypothetical protein [Fimbriiglobus ruber]
MTEENWLSATNPTPMLEFLQGKASDRKLRLYAVAILTTGMSPDTNREYRARMECAERFADGRVPVEVLREQWGSSEITWAERAYEWAFDLTRQETVEDPQQAEPLAYLLRDIFNPFYPITLDPAWQTPTVLSLAEGIYTDSAFDRLPILADALEESGCDNPDLLNHCRSEGPHTRGCWAIDRLLGKE